MIPRRISHDFARAKARLRRVARRLERATVDDPRVPELIDAARRALGVMAERSDYALGAEWCNCDECAAGRLANLGADGEGS